MRLAQGFVVRGVVRDPAGKPVAGAGVRHGRDGDSVTTAADGSFVLGRLPEPDVDLYVTEGPYVEAGREDRRPVHAGSDVVLEIDLGLELTVEIVNPPSTLGIAELTPLPGPEFSRRRCAPSKP